MSSHSPTRGVALVTGAAGAIGSAIAVRLAHDGYDIVIADLVPAESTARAVEDVGRRAYVRVCDLADSEAVQLFGAEFVDDFGRCDVLVNNAAHMVLAPLDSLEIDTWRQMQAVNVDAPFLLCRALAPGMIAAGSGRVVNIISNTLWDPPGPGFIAYVASKGSLLGLTRALAVELTGTGVTVNAVAPGLTETPAALAGNPADAFAAVLERQAVRRPLVPEDHAAAVAFLVSEGASAITGQSIRVDGGLVML